MPFLERQRVVMCQADLGQGISRCDLTLERQARAQPKPRPFSQSGQVGLNLVSTDCLEIYTNYKAFIRLGPGLDSMFENPKWSLYQMRVKQKANFLGKTRTQKHACVLVPNQPSISLGRVIKVFYFLRNSSILSNQLFLQVGRAEACDSKVGSGQDIAQLSPTQLMNTPDLCPYIGT